MLKVLKYLFTHLISRFKKGLHIVYHGAICLFSRVDNDKIVFCAHQGRCSINCNPKYILKEIIRQKLPYKLVWLCDKEIMTHDSEYSQVEFVDYKDFSKNIRELATSKIWIDNVCKTREIGFGLIKKKNQFYLNTWHGSLGIKKMYWDMQSINACSGFFLKCLDRDFKNCDLLLSDSRWEENVFRSAFRYEGKIERTGHPRNDIFFEDKEPFRKKIFEKYNISPDSKIVLYIPTFRTPCNLECYSVDYQKLKESLSNKFGEKWTVLTKFHPVDFELQKEKLKKYAADVDVTLYPDTQELLAISDIVISDYSSAMFDFMMTKRPCFIYASDIEDYNQDRGFYYPLDDTPFPVAVNNEELSNNILNFDYENYIKKCDKFLEEKKVLEDGNASKRVVEIIKSIMDNKNYLL